jgi:hypothetical protein
VEFGVSYVHLFSDDKPTAFLTGAPGNMIHTACISARASCLRRGQFHFNVSYLEENTSKKNMVGMIWDVMVPSSFDTCTLYCRFLAQNQANGTRNNGAARIWER